MQVSNRDRVSVEVQKAYNKAHCAVAVHYKAAVNNDVPAALWGLEYYRICLRTDCTWTKTAEQILTKANRRTT